MKILLHNWNNILTDVAQELSRRGHEILEWDGREATFKKAELILLWNETELGGWKDWIRKAKKRNKKVILFQHGRKGTSRIYPPFNEKLESDIVCVWGPKDKERLMSVGVPEDKIRITGTTIFDHLIPRTKHKGFNVVFSPEHWDKEVEENLWVADELRKLKRVGLKKINVFTKGLENECNYNWYQNLILSNRLKPDHLDIVAQVLSQADLVVAISESTFELLAQSLGIPVIIADVWIPKACAGDDRYKEYHREYSDAVEMVSLKDLNKTIKKHLRHPELLKKQRERVVVGDGGPRNALQEIIKIIEDAKNN